MTALKEVCKLSVERAMQDLGQFLPYEHITERTAITPKSKALLGAVNKIRKLDSTTKRYLLRYLAKRHVLLDDIFKIEKGETQ